MGSNYGSGNGLPPYPLLGLPAQPVTAYLIRDRGGQPIYMVEPLQLSPGQRALRSRQSQGTFKKEAQRQCSVCAILWIVAIVKIIIVVIIIAS
jgi:hypothetical protein